MALFKKMWVILAIYINDCLLLEATKISYSDKLSHMTRTTLS